MKNSLSSNGDTFVWLLGFSILSILSLALVSSNGGAGVCCAVLLFAILFFMGRLLLQTVKAVVSVGSNAASSVRRKGYPEHEWTNDGEMLNAEHPYTIGDDGELIELDTDEKRKRDDATN